MSKCFRYASFAQSLPSGHVFQNRIENVQCSLGCQAATSDIQTAVNAFQNPDVESSKTANAAALGIKVKQKTLPPSKVTITVVNGNGVAGAAADAGYKLGPQGRGYDVLDAPNGLSPNITPAVFHTKIYYDPAQKGSKAAAVALQNLMQPADVAKLPRRQKLLRLDPGSMLMVVLGTTFHGDITPLPTHVAPKHEPAYVRYDASSGAQLLRSLHGKVRFPAVHPDRAGAQLVP